MLDGATASCVWFVQVDVGENMLKCILYEKTLSDNHFT